MTNNALPPDEILRDVHLLQRAPGWDFKRIRMGYRAPHHATRIVGDLSCFGYQSQRTSGKPPGRYKIRPLAFRWMSQVEIRDLSTSTLHFVVRCSKVSAMVFSHRWAHVQMLIWGLTLKSDFLRLLDSITRRVQFRINWVMVMWWLCVMMHADSTENSTWYPLIDGSLRCVSGVQCLLPAGRLYLVSAIFDANFLSIYEINDKEARSQWLCFYSALTRFSTPCSMFLEARIRRSDTKKSCTVTNDRDTYRTIRKYLGEAQVHVQRHQHGLAPDQER